MKRNLSLLLLLTLTACSIPVDKGPSPTAPPIDTVQRSVASTSAQPFMPIATVAGTAVSIPFSTFCHDPRGRDVVTALLRAIQTKDSALLSSLVSPSRGMDVMFYRNGKVINYDAEHAKSLFESTDIADWGLSFGSGESTLGSFQEIVLPSLQVVMIPSAELVCNELKVGGATYVPEWPYPYMDYESVYFAGTDPSAGLDWQTWAIGIDNDKAADKFYIAALVHYVWEP